MAMARDWPVGTDAPGGNIRRWLARVGLAAATGHGLEPTGTAADGAGADAQAFEGFVRQYERQILNYLWRMTGDEQAAYDLTQETLLRAWQHFAQVRHYEQPRAWLFRVATNLALTFRQRRAQPVGAAVALSEDNSPASSDPAMRFAERDLVREILQELPPRRRAALVLREVYGLSADEAAQALGMTREAVKMALYRARVQFRALYAAKEARE